MIPVSESVGFSFGYIFYCIFFDMSEFAKEATESSSDAGLRKRRPSVSSEIMDPVTGKEATKGSNMNTGTIGEQVERYVIAFSEKIPKPLEKVIPFVVKAAPMVGMVVDLMNKSIPYFIMAWHKYLELKKELAPYRLELLLPSFLGFIMCFFGGTFVTLIAAFEAYRMSAWPHTRQCIQSLYEDFKLFNEANKKDDAKDDDNDGIRDVLQISNDQLLQRKLLLFLKTVDPKRVTDAIKGINGGFLAVVATLKLQFAKAITLGSSIAEGLKVPAKTLVVPLVEGVLPDDYKRWGETIVFFQIDTISISIAWTLQRIISAFHSALIGGLLISRNMLVYLEEMKIVTIKAEDTYLDEIVGYGLSALGLFFQLTLGFGLPFPLNVLLFPFTVLEWLLVRIVMSN